VDRLSRDDAWSFQLNSLTHVGVNGTMSIDGVSESIDDSSEKGVTDGHIDNGSCSLDDISFLNLSIERTGLLYG